ncbi:MAG: hypothetical protein NSGCLCUN01_04042 [uncultured Clostridium sp.]
MTNNKTVPNINISSKNRNSIIKVPMPVIDASVYTSPLIESIQQSLNPLTKTINLSISSSLQPLLGYINEFNKQISSMNSLMANALLDSLKNFKTITSYTTETIESISKYELSKTLDNVYDSLNKLEFNDETLSLATKCKNEIISTRNDLDNSKSKKIEVTQWINAMITVISIIIGILNLFDNSNEVLIEQNNQIIEIESSELRVLENIDNSLKNLIK